MRIDPSVDALSDVLALIRLQGGELSRTEDDGAGAAHAAEERMLHLVERGEVELSTAAGERVLLAAGDLALLAAGTAHRLRSRNDGVWMSGRFRVEETTAAPLLAQLPSLIAIRASEVELDLFPIGARLLAMELDDPAAGSMVMVSRILDLLFVRALRVWSARELELHPGWLTAALDRSLGPAVSAMHRHPEQPWPVERLASLAALSRAAFSARFLRLMGEPPARYLTRVRLTRAAELLANTTEAVGAIGRTVGYASEPAFSRAFARAFGSAPRDWRAVSRRDQAETVASVSAQNNSV